MLTVVMSMWYAAANNSNLDDRRPTPSGCWRMRMLHFACCMLHFACCMLHFAWCMLHFATYTAAGALAPDYWWLLIACGVVFEYVEDYLSSYSQYIDSNVIGDSLVNTGGVVFGMFLRNVAERALG